MDWWTFLTWMLQIVLALAVGAILVGVGWGIWREFRDARDDSLWHRSSECETWREKMRLEDGNGS